MQPYVILPLDPECKRVCRQKRCDTCHKQDNAAFKLRLDHPSETEIRTYVSSLVASIKRKRKRADDGENVGASSSQPRLNIALNEEEYIQNTAENNPTMKPEAFYALFIEEFPLSMVSKDQATGKFSRCKLKVKK